MFFNSIGFFSNINLMHKCIAVYMYQNMHKYIYNSHILISHIKMIDMV